MNTRTIFAALFFLLAIACSQQTEKMPPVDEQTHVQNEKNDPQSAQETSDQSNKSKSFDDGAYTLETARSTLGWSASRIAGTPHIGTAALKEGALIIEQGTVWGDFTIDLTKLTETKNNERFLNHIKSADFFDIGTHPTAQFTINDAEQNYDGTYSINGDLTIKNITNKITFPATLISQNGELHANASFEINRLNWNITYDSGSIFSELGDRAIKDEIKYDIALIFVKS